MYTGPFQRSAIFTIFNPYPPMVGNHRHSSKMPPPPPLKRRRRHFCKHAEEFQLLTYCEVSSFYHPQIPDQLLYAEKAILTRLPWKNHKVCCREGPKLYFSHSAKLKFGLVWPNTYWSWRLKISQITGKPYTLRFCTLQIKRKMFLGILCSL